MRHRRLTLLGLAAAGLSLASIAGVCGEPDPVATQVSATATGIVTADTAMVGPTETATGALTPEPSATPRPKAFRFPAVAVRTASSASDPMVIGGVLWVNGAAQTGEVTAFIDGKECGRGQSLIPPDGGPFFVVSIASDAAQPGCGTPGAPVTISVNGRPMDDTVEWQPGFQQAVSLFAGPVVAQYGGDIRVDRSIIPLLVVAYVGDTVCGRTGGLRGDGEIASYQVEVEPEEVSPACGRDGALVVLRLEGKTAAGDAFDVVIATAPWQPGPLTRIPDVDLSGQIATTPVATAPGGQ